jgi:uncharacterized protein YutE (UPF0331/DUF86 family)
MTPVDRDIVRRKLAVIMECLTALERIGKMDAVQFDSDLYMRKAAERMLQELIEAAIDINTHLSVGSGSAAPDDYYESFLKAADIGALSRDLALQLAPSAGLRNRLVHEYDVLDRALVLESLRKALVLYPRYVAAVERFVS